MSDFDEVKITRRLEELGCYVATTYKSFRATPTEGTYSHIITWDEGVAQDGAEAVFLAESEQSPEFVNIAFITRLLARYIYWCITSGALPTPPPGKLKKQLLKLRDRLLHE